MSALHVDPIQSGRIALIRWSSQPVLSASGALHVLLAAVLLGIIAWGTRTMSISMFNGDGRF
jgi:hypothetical protein